MKTVTSIERSEGLGWARVRELEANGYTRLELRVTDSQMMVNLDDVDALMSALDTWRHAWFKYAIS